METEPARDGTALIFPGMGPTKFTEIAKFLLTNRRARAMLATADEVLGHCVFDRALADDGDDYAEHTQVIFLVTCLAMAYWAEDEFGLDPAYCTGPSFGGKAAAVYSGALDLAGGIRLTAEISRRERDYFAQHHSDVVTQSFTRASPALLAELTGQLGEWGEVYEVSCHLDDDFYMVTLREGRLEWFKQGLRAQGALPLYTMRPPMHAAAFAPLRDIVAREVLAGIEFTDPRLPIVADQDGALLTTAEQVRQLMLDGFVRPVRWPEVVSALRSLGVGRVYVAGPDNVWGRVRRTTSTFETIGLHPRQAVRPVRRETPPVPVAAG